MSDLPSPFRLEAAMSALMQRHAELLQSDPTLAEDEGELLRLMDVEAGSDAMDVLRRLVRATIMVEGRVDEAEKFIGSMETRKRRYQRRATALRETVLAAMQALDMRRLPAPDFTVSRRVQPPKVIIIDEQAVPPQFVRVTTTTSPDKAAISAALRQGTVVAGAAMDNGGETVAIRTI